MRLGELISKAKVERCGNRQLPVLSMTMHDGIVRQKDRFKKTIASKDTSTYKVVYPHQLVVGFPIDEGVIYVQNFDGPGIMSPAYNVWDIDPSKVRPAYLELALHSPQTMTYYSAQMKGTTARRRTLSTDKLRDIKVVLPPLEQQLRIVRLFHHIRELQHANDARESLLDTLVKSRFAEMFGDAKSGKILPLKECCISLASGKTPSMKHPEYYGGDIPFIKSGDVTGDNVSTGALSLSNLALKQASVKMVPAGSILVVTRSARLRKEVHCAICVNDVAINQDIKAFTPTPDFTSEYLLWAIRAHEQDLLKTVRSVSTSGMDLGTLYGIGIRQAPLALQREFADFAAAVDKLRVGVRRLRALYGSLAQEYFRDTDPNPANCIQQTLQIVHATSP